MNHTKVQQTHAQVDQQARQWFERLHLCDEAPSQQQLQAFKHWLQANPLHAKRYKQLEQLWRDMPLATVDSPDAHNKSRWTKPLYAIAASLFAVCLCLFMLIQDPQVSEHYSTKLGQTQQITLKDGSIITLGAKSSIVAKLSSKSRHVELISGQAYFNIAHKQNIPFTIQASLNSIRVLGTEFEVKTSQRETKVSVKQGLVAVNNSVHQHIQLSGGQQARINKQGHMQVAKLNNTDSFNWQSGQFSYVDTPLSEVLADINRYRKTQVKLEDSTLEQLKVTTAFSVEQIEQMLAGLSYSENLQLSELGFITLIKRK